MPTLLFELQLRRKKDLLQARRLIRQAGELLGFEPTALACLASATFECAFKAWVATHRAEVRLEMDERTLFVSFVTREKAGRPLESSANPTLSRPLPETAKVARTDLPWMLLQLVELTRLDLFEEFQRMNRELMQTLIQLSASRSQAAEAEAKANAESSAA